MNCCMGLAGVLASSISLYLIPLALPQEIVSRWLCPKAMRIARWANKRRISCYDDRCKCTRCQPLKISASGLAASKRRSAGFRVPSRLRMPWIVGSRMVDYLRAAFTR